MSVVKFITNNVSLLYFNHLCKNLEKDIKDLNPEDINNEKVAKNIVDRFKNINQNLSNKDNLESSTKVQGLAYELQKKVSRSSLSNEVKTGFLSRLQEVVNNSFEVLYRDVIRIIASFLPDERDIDSLALVCHKTHNAMTPEFRLARLQNQFIDLNREIYYLCKIGGPTTKLKLIFKLQKKGELKARMERYLQTKLS